MAERRLTGGWQMSMESVREKASEAPGYTTFELALTEAVYYHDALAETVAHVLRYGKLGKQSRIRLRAALNAGPEES